MVARRAEPVAVAQRQLRERDLPGHPVATFDGIGREAQVPALLEMIGNVRYTGPGPLSAALTQDKPLTKQVLPDREYLPRQDLRL